MVKRLFDHRGALVYSLPHGCIQRLCASVESTRTISTLPPKLAMCYRRVKGRSTALDRFEAAAKTGFSSAQLVRARASMKARS